ncbi:MAG: hypothetical protein ACOX0A_09410 [Thermoguttaceae bacterium]|jgi:hypothetical protein
MNKSIFVAAVLVAVVAVVGCKPKAPYGLIPISGVATYQGQPIPEGFRIEFEPTDGSRASFGNIEAGGRFEAIHTASQKGVKAGPCKVRIYWNKNPETEPVPEEYSEMMAKYGMSGPDALDVTIEKKSKDFKVEFP